MRPITMLESQFKIDTKTGESLHFENCKGGYFSVNEEYGLKVSGKSMQIGISTPEKPVPIQCVKKGTKIICGNEFTVPCDLYDGDIWYPAGGYVIRDNEVIDLSKGEKNSPVILVYKLKQPIVEPYDPQYLFAPQGTANVTQKAIELPANLSATMLKYRNTL